MLAGTLEYELDPNQLVTTIKNPLGKTLMTIAFSDIARS
jgi:hypothetical protein